MKIIAYILVLLQLIFCVGVTAAEDDFVNVALYKPASALNFLSDDFSPSMANDGINANSKYTAWVGAETEEMLWWQVDLAMGYTISSIEIEARVTAHAAAKRNFEVIGSNDPEFANPTLLAEQGGEAYSNIWKADSGSKASFRYIRVRKTLSEDFSIGEIRLLVNKSSIKAGAASVTEAVRTPREPLGAYEIPADIENTKYAAKVQLLEQLGLMSAFVDNNFYPDEDLTTREYSAVMRKLTAGGGIYTSIIYENIVRDLVNLTGFSVYAESRGGFPTGYMSVASQYRITGGVSGNMGIPATRGQFAELLYNALSADMLIQDTFGKNSEGRITKGRNYLREYFHIEKRVGRVTKTNRTGLTTTNKTVKGFLEIDNLTYRTALQGTDKYLGMQVDYYVTIDTDSEVVKIIIPTLRNKTLRVLAKDIKNYGSFSFTYEITKERTKSIKLDRRMDVIYNGAAKTSYNDADFIIPYGHIEFLDSNDDDIFDTVFIYNTEVLLVHWVDTKNQVIYSKNSRTPIKLYDNDVTITGAAKTINELEEWDLICVTQAGLSGREDIINIIVTREAVTGILTEISDEYIIIKNTEYELSYNMADYVFNISEKYTVYIDMYGNIAGVNIPIANGDKYGYLTDAIIKEDIDGNILFRMYTETGKFLTIKGRDKITVDLDENLSHAAILARLTANNQGTGIAQIVRYRTNSNGDLFHLDTLHRGINEADDNLSHTYTADNVYYKDTGIFNGNCTYSDTVVIFNVPEDPARENLFSLGSKGMFENDRQYSFVGYDGGETRELNAMVIKSSSQSIREDSSIFVVDKITKSINSDGIAANRLYGLTGGSYQGYFEDTSGYFESLNLSCGDLVRLKFNGMNEVMECRRVFDRSPNPDTEVVTPYNPQVNFIFYGYHFGFGEVIIKNGSKIILKMDTAPDPTDMMIDISTLNIYRVDTANQRVHIAAPMDIIDSKSAGVGNGSKVFFRTRSGNVHEVIILD